MIAKDADIAEERQAARSAAQRAAMPDLEDPRVVLSLLEADQVVAAKQRTHFGRRRLSIPLQILLWSLRVYVVIMLGLVLVSVIYALHAIR